MNIPLTIVFIAFWVLLVASAFSESKRKIIFARKKADWILDGVGLIIQGWLIPLLQIGIVGLLFKNLFPSYAGSLSLHPVVAFLLNFVVVDYLYYWNHRLLHTRSLWNVHAVHHSAKDMDVLVTSRNTFWTSGLIIYVWTNSFFVFFLENPLWYLIGGAVTAALDLWRHSGFKLAQPIENILRSVLVTPTAHAWHHSALRFDVNFGANWTLWDRLHGTYEKTEAWPKEIGVDLKYSLARKMFFPFGGGA